MKKRYSWKLCAILPVLQHQSISQKVWYYGKSRALVIFLLKKAASDLEHLTRAGRLRLRRPDRRHGGPSLRRGPVAAALE